LSTRLSNEVDALASYLVEAVGAGHQTVVSWLNHHSVQVSFKDPVSCAALAQTDIVGTDGLLLAGLVGAKARTSADQLIPMLLPRLGATRICVIGSTEESLALALPKLAELLGSGSTIVGAMNGYEALLRESALGAWIDSLEADVVIVGVGPGLQDAIAIEAKNNSSSRLILTCGGFLDQIHQNSYYPAWAYPLKLNWAVRLCREPRRLWRRYSLDAISAVRRRSLIAERVSGLDGFQQYQRLF
jgi:UDP-N-acetyl-D-mannosaminuronic acid transferase (WecB/TagA/CpsF family)